VGSTGAPLPSGARVSRCVGSVLSVGRLASWSPSVARSGQSESDGLNKFHRHVVGGVRGVGGAISRTSRIGGVRAADQRAGGWRGVPPPQTSPLRLPSPAPCTEFGLDSYALARSARLWSDRRVSLSTTGRRTIYRGTFRGRCSSREGKLAQLPLIGGDLTEAKATTVKGRALFSLTPGPSQATRHARAANVPRSST
jgi:hypothetical protein